MTTFAEHMADQAALTALCESGECDHPECHGQTAENELVDRSAPRWAWEIIDQTLANDAVSKAFDADTRQSVQNALNAMMLACEGGHNFITEEQAEDFE